MLVGEFLSANSTSFHRESIKTIYYSQRFVDLCNGRIPVGGMTLMKDISLAKTGAKGEFLYNKVQDIVYDEVFATYMFCPEVNII